MPVKSSFSTSNIVKNREDNSITKTNQNAQIETRQTNSNVVQRIAARLARVEEKFSHFPVIESYLQNNKISNSTLEDKFKFIEFAGAKLNEKVTTADDSLLTSVEDSVKMIEKQLFKNTNFNKDDLRNRILRIGRFQESNYKTIKQQINNLISDPDISFDVMKQILSRLSNQMNEQQQIPNNDFDNIETLKNITKIAYSPQSTIEMLRDSLKKSLIIQQNSQTKIQELLRKAKYLEEQVQIAMRSSNQQQNYSDDLSIFTESRDLSNNGYVRSAYVSSTPTRNVQRPARLTSVSSTPRSGYQYQSSWTSNPRKNRTFDLDDDSEMDSFALREAFEPEVKDQYQDQLEQINAQMRRQGMSMRDINAANEAFTDCFIDLRSKILVQQDAISSLEKEKMQVDSLREKLAQQEALVRKLQATLKDSIKENPEYKKQLKTIQLLTVKLNQAKNKIVFNQENMQKIKTQLQEKEDQRKRTETENKNLRKDLDMIQQAFEMSSVDAENLKNLEMQSKGIKGLLDRLKKTERMCEDQQIKLYNMYNLVIKLKNRLNSNGIQIPEEEENEIKMNNPKSRANIESASLNDDENNNQSTRSKSQTKLGENLISIRSQNNQAEANSYNKAYFNSSNDSFNEINNENQNIRNRGINQFNGERNNNQNIGTNDNNETNSNGNSGKNSSNENINDINNSCNTEVSSTENSNNSSILNFAEELEKMKSKCESQETQINSLKEENDKLNNSKEEEKKKYESQIKTLNERISSLEHDKQGLHKISLKQSSNIENIQAQMNKLQSEADIKISSITKKITDMNDSFKSFISVHKLGSFTRNDKKTIDELTQNLQLANKTITTLRDEKDSLLRILCSESNRFKVPDDKLNRGELTNNSSTDRFQLNLQQIDEQVTCQIDDVKNVKSSILNENQKEAF